MSVSTITVKEIISRVRMGFPDTPEKYIMSLIWMFELFADSTPNARKISIMLEEIGFDYKVTKIDISKGEQFNPEFKNISPFNKTPVIIDHENGKSIFESGAILIYLGEKSGKFYNEKDRNIINQWLMAQMGNVCLLYTSPSPRD